MSCVIVVGTSHGLALVFGKLPLYDMCLVVKCISHSNSNLYNIDSTDLSCVSYFFMSFY